MTRHPSSNALEDTIGEWWPQIIKHPDFPHLLRKFVRDCDDLDDLCTIEREERRERLNDSI